MVSDNPEHVKLLPPVTDIEHRTFYQMNEDGIVELIDVITGDVIAVQHTVKDLIQDPKNNFIEMALPLENGQTKLVLVQKGMSLEGLKPRSLAYSDVIADLIIQKVVEGMTLTKVCALEGFPSYSVVARWKSQYPDFREKLAEARRDRADHFHDKIIDTVDEPKYREDKKTVVDKNTGEETTVIEKVKVPLSTEDIQTRKMQVEAYKWAASVGNPDAYGTRTKLVGDANSPIGFVVDTGIRRQGDQGFVNHESPPLGPSAANQEMQAPEAIDVSPREEKND